METLIGRFDIERFIGAAIVKALLSVLVVEDEPTKRARVIAAIREVEGARDADIVEVADLSSARRALFDRTFDLLVLDIALPQQGGGAIDKRAGIQLLLELRERDLYNMPGAVIGLTAFDDVLIEGRDLFDQHLRHLLRYDQRSDEWVGAFSAGVSDVVLAAIGRHEASKRYGLDLVVICALQDPEMAAIRRLPWGLQPHTFDDDASTYFSGSFSRAGGSGEVIAAYSSRMGVAAAAVLATKMIRRFRPRLLAMTGVAAGWKEKTLVGDILVADPTWDCGSGKYEIDDNGEVQFLQEPHQLDLDPVLREAARRLSDSASTLADIRSSFPGTKPGSELRVQVGPVASNVAVVADGVTLAAIVRHQNRRTLGLEMETYGIFAAALEARVPQTSAVSLKAVVDFADGEKDKTYQPYGAWVSAFALNALVSHHIPASWWER